MKVVKRKIDNQIVYRSEPEFKVGVGIKNAVVFNGGRPEDYVEVEINQVEWETYLKSLRPVSDPILMRLEELEARILKLEKL